MSVVKLSEVQEILEIFVRYAAEIYDWGVKKIRKKIGRLRSGGWTRQRCYDVTEPAAEAMFPNAGSGRLNSMRLLKRLLGPRSSSRPERLFIHHHLALGDTFTCNAIVRRLAEVVGNGEIHLFAKECNVANVRFLYRDDPRIRVVPLPLSRDNPIGERAMVRAYVRAYRASRGEYVRIGFDCMEELHRRFGRGLSCDQSYYVQAGLPYELRFTGFYFKRDLELEEQVYRRFNPSGQPYAFVDADPARGTLIPTLDEAVDAGAVRGLRRLFNDPSVPLLQMGLILERAQELHLCESSIRCLLEGTNVFQPGTRSLFLHTFRGGIWGANTVLQWTQLGAGRGDVTRPEPFPGNPSQIPLLDAANRWAQAAKSRDPLRLALSHLSKNP